MQQVSNCKRQCVSREVDTQIDPGAELKSNKTPVPFVAFTAALDVHILSFLGLTDLNVMMTTSQYTNDVTKSTLRQMQAFTLGHSPEVLRYLRLLRFASKLEIVDMDIYDSWEVKNYAASTGDDFAAFPLPGPNQMLQFMSDLILSNRDTLQKIDLPADLRTLPMYTMMSLCPLKQFTVPMLHGGSPMSEVLCIETVIRSCARTLETLDMCGVNPGDSDDLADSDLRFRLVRLMALCKLPKLQVLKLGGATKEIMDFLSEFSPNLTELHLAPDLGMWSLLGEHAATAQHPFAHNALADFFKGFESHLFRLKKLSKLALRLAYVSPDHAAEASHVHWNLPAWLTHVWLPEKHTQIPLLHATGLVEASGGFSIKNIELICHSNPNLENLSSFRAIEHDDDREQWRDVLTQKAMGALLQCTNLHTLKLDRCSMTLPFLLEFARRAGKLKVLYAVLVDPRATLRESMEPDFVKPFHSFPDQVSIHDWISRLFTLWPLLEACALRLNSTESSVRQQDSVQGLHSPDFAMLRIQDGKHDQKDENDKGGCDGDEEENTKQGRSVVTMHHLTTLKLKNAEPSLCRIYMPKLTKLILRGEIVTQDNSLSFIRRNCPNLRHLQLVSISWLQDHDLLELTRVTKTEAQIGKSRKSRKSLNQSGTASGTARFLVGNGKESKHTSLQLPPQQQQQQQQHAVPGLPLSVLHIRSCPKLTIMSVINLSVLTLLLPTLLNVGLFSSCTGIDRNEVTTKLVLDVLTQCGKGLGRILLPVDGESETLDLDEVRTKFPDIAISTE